MRSVCSLRHYPTKLHPFLHAAGITPLRFTLDAIQSTPFSYVWQLSQGRLGRIIYLKCIYTDDSSDCALDIFESRFILHKGRTLSRLRLMASLRAVRGGSITENWAHARSRWLRYRCTSEQWEQWKMFLRNCIAEIQRCLLLDERYHVLRLQNIANLSKTWGVSNRRQKQQAMMAVWRRRKEVGYVRNYASPNTETSSLVD